MAEKIGVNNMKYFLGVFLACIGLILFIVGLVSGITAEPNGYKHTGKELFNETEFLEFKTVMASDDVNYIKFEVLNVDYPVLVQYSFVSTDDTKLWDEDIEDSYGRGLDILFLLLLAFPFIIGGVLMIGEYK
jgi:hypothetical protein